MVVFRGILPWIRGGRSETCIGKGRLGVFDGPFIVFKVENVEGCAVEVRGCGEEREGVGEVRQTGKGNAGRSLDLYWPLCLG
jgi:hypothetical protein